MDSKMTWMLAELHAVEFDIEPSWVQGVLDGTDVNVRPQVSDYILELDREWEALT